MKTQVVILFVSLVPSIFAFYPYKPSWMSSESDYLISIGSDGEGLKKVTDVVQDIPKMRLRRMQSSQKRDIVTSTEPTQSNSAAIDQDGIDYSYFAEVDFGSNKTPLWMLLDTGAISTWVPATGCESTSCLMPTHETYGPANSTTYQTTTATFDIAYGTGSVSGSYISDTVSIAGLSVDLTFGAANVTSDDFNNFPFDGILGLGYATVSRSIVTFMGAVAEKKLLKANIFGIDLSRASDGTNDGEINFGAPDTSKYNGSLVYTDVASGSSTWSISVDDASYNGKSAGLSGKTAIIDTGTTWIFLPPADAKLLFDLVEDATLNDSNDTYYVSCDTTTPIQFTFSGVGFDISSEDWVGTVVDSGENLCASNIYPVDAVGNGDWLVGDTFLKNVYAVFDYDQSRVGFGAKSTNSTASSASKTALSSASGTASPSSTSTESPLLPAAASHSASTTSSTASASATSNSNSSSAASTTRLDWKNTITYTLFLGLCVFLL